MLADVCVAAKPNPKPGSLAQFRPQRFYKASWAFRIEAEGLSCGWVNGLGLLGFGL